MGWGCAQGRDRSRASGSEKMRCLAVWKGTMQFEVCIDGGLAPLARCLHRWRSSSARLYSVRGPEGYFRWHGFLTNKAVT